MLQSYEGSVDAAGARRGARPGRSWMVAAGSLCLALVMMMVAVPASAGSHNPNSPKYWKGKNIAEASKKFGDPTQMTPLPDTGGTLYIFAHHGEQHWVFETEAGGKIVKAAKVE